jgi:hypothetical protein
LQAALDPIGNRFYRVDAYGTLFACSLKPVDNLDPVVTFPSAVFFNHQWHHFLDPLISGKPTVAIGTLAPPPDHIAVLAQAGIDHSIIGLMAEGTFHPKHSTCNSPLIRNRQNASGF